MSVVAGAGGLPDYALEHSIKYGIWGGESERARRVMRRERAS